MGAQVISGIGFLGVGTIMVTGRNQVRGLDHGGMPMVCACEGLAAGIGFVDGVLWSDSDCSYFEVPDTRG